MPWNKININLGGNLKNIINKIIENKMLSFVVLAFMLVLGLWCCRTFSAHANESNNLDANEVESLSETSGIENSSDEAPLEAYAYKSEACAETVLVLRYDRLKKEASTYHQVVYDNLPTAATQASDWPWDRDRSEFDYVIIEDDFKNYSELTSTAYMFSNFSCTTGQQLDGFKNLNTSNVTTMSNMFNGYGGRSSIYATPDISSWDISNVTDTSYMFSNYGNNCVISSFDLSKFDTSKITNSTKMLEGMKLNSIILGSNFNLDLSVSGLCLTNGSGATSATWFDKIGIGYENCGIGTLSRTEPTTYYDTNPCCAYGYKDTTSKEGKTILVLAYDTEKASRQVSQKVYDIPTDNANSPYWPWSEDRRSFTTVKVSDNFKYYKGLKNTSLMFSQFTQVSESEGFENLDTSNVTDMTGMFFAYGCAQENLNNVPNVSNWNTSHVKSMCSMFGFYAFSSTNLSLVPDVSKWDTSQVTNLYGMFNNYGSVTKELKDLPNLKNWDTSNVTDVAFMFSVYGPECIFENLDLSNFDTTHVTKYENMLGKFKIKSVTLGSKFNLNLNSSGADLTNSSYVSNATWYDKAGSKYDGCGMGTIARTEAVTYYDSPQTANSEQISLNSSDNSNYLDVLNKKDNSLDKRRQKVKVI